MHIPLIVVADCETIVTNQFIDQWGADDYIIKDRLTRLPIAIRNAQAKIQVQKERDLYLNLLVKNEKYYRALIKDPAEAVVIFNFKGAPVFLSPTIPRLLGFNEDDITNLDLYTLIPSCDKERLDLIISECIDTPGKPVGPYEIAIRHKEGHWDLGGSKFNQHVP